MEENEILEGNKLIAEFMGFKQKSYTPESEKLWCDNKHGLPVGELKFHTSWDWLMPVVEKISKLKIGDGIETVEYAHPRTFGMVKQETGNFMVRLNGFTVHESETLLESTYKAVIEFIKYYNHPKQQ